MKTLLSTLALLALLSLPLAHAGGDKTTTTEHVDSLNIGSAGSDDPVRANDNRPRFNGWMAK